MAKIDIRKISELDLEYYHPVGNVVPKTFISRLCNITEAGRAVLATRFTFCKLLRTLTHRIQIGVPCDKPKLQKQFGVTSRAYNTARVCAQGVLDSALACQITHLDDLQASMDRKIDQAFRCSAREYPGRKKAIERLLRRERKLIAQMGKPHIHFGGQHYQKQEKAAWKKAYQEKRNDRIGAMGSADETGGNSTYQIRLAATGSKYAFDVFHAGQRVGSFNLDTKERIVLESILAVNLQPFTHTQVKCLQGPRKGQWTWRKETQGRVALTVWLIREERKYWTIHISYMDPGQDPDYSPLGSMGVDLNTKSIASAVVSFKDGALVLEQHRLDEFDPKWAKEVKREWIYGQVRRIVAEAQHRNYAVVLEYLDFEGCKRWMRTKLGQMLRVMPYRQIRRAFERNCLEHGVVLRYVRPHGTSVLGAVLSEYPNLGRDEAAGVVIGLRGYEEGNQWLEKRCEELLSREGCRLRINRKGKYGCTVSIEGALVSGQSDTETSVHRFQNRAVRAIQSLSKAMDHFYFKKKWVPTRWKWARPPEEDKDAWHAVVPRGMAPPQNPPCSTLSKAV